MWADCRRPESAPERTGTLRSFRPRDYLTSSRLDGVMRPTEWYSCFVNYPRRTVLSLLTCLSRMDSKSCGQIPMKFSRSIAHHWLRIKWSKFKQPIHDRSLGEGADFVAPMFCSYCLTYYHRLWHDNLPRGEECYILHFNQINLSNRKEAFVGIIIFS